MKRLFALVATVYLFCALAWLAIAGAVATHPLQSFVLYASCLAVLYLIVFRLLRPGINKGALFSPSGIIISGVLLRIMFLPYPLTDDVNRYAWSGHILNTQSLPYLDSPLHYAEAFKTDPIFVGIQNKDTLAVYPPVTLLAFRLVSGISYSLRAYKLFFILCDILTLLVVSLLLREWNVPWHRLILYAWNPLVLLYAAGEGHAIGIPILFGACSLLLFARAKRVQAAWLMDSLAFFSLGVACMSCFLSLVVLPFIISRRTVRYLPWLLVPFLLFIPCWQPGMFSVALSSLELGACNDVFPRLIRLGFSGMPYLIITLSLLLAGIGAAWIFFQRSPLKGLMFSFFWCILCLPCVHPWYLLPFALLLLPHPNRAIFLFCITFGFAFWSPPFLPGFFQERSWTLYTIYMPVLLMLIYDWENTRLPWFPSYPRMRTLDIIVPALSDAGRITFLLESLAEALAFAHQNCTHFPKTSITVVTDDRDETLCKSIQDFPVSLLQESTENGDQLKCAVTSSSSDCILFLTPDTVNDDSALLRLYAALNRNPAAAWGILGHSYTSRSLKRTWLRPLHFFSFHLLGFADSTQGIFILRTALTAAGGLPPGSPMQDTELSLRLQSLPRLDVRCTLLHFSPHKNFKTLTLSLLYLLNRRLGLNRESGV